MSTVKKYSTFEALKSDEKKSLESEESLKKHLEFERALKSISAKIEKARLRKSK